ncbi:MAG: M28 family peptidase, partial [Gemmatimonadetes bacterium]|nr:M28 family peptidase [Gemmatimonadota bacterium]
MAPSRAEIDRWIVGEAWVGSQLDAHLVELCDRIGPRWSGTEGERRAVEYIRGRMADYGLDEPRLEEFEFDSWEHEPAEARVIEEGLAVDALPFLCCPPTDVRGSLVDAGFGTPHALDAVRGRLPGAVALVNLTLEPFTDPQPLPARLKALAAAGAAAAVVVERKSGRRMEYHSANDFREGHAAGHPLPTVVTSREGGALLRRLAAEGKSLSLRVRSRAYRATGLNTVADLRGDSWPDESIVVCGHHDTLMHTPGGNDNASGTVVVMEVARVLASLRRETGAGPGCTLRFVTFGAEELTLQGSTAYVERHHGPEPLPRFVLNADELA